MRSAQLTTSPSGVDGAGRDQQWLRIPSSVSAHRLSEASDTPRPPRRVVEALGDVGVEGVLAGVAARAVTAVVAEGDGLGEGHVQPAGAGHPGGHLGHLEGVGEPGPLVVLGEDEHLGLAGQPPEGRRVQDAVPVALEARPPRVGLLGPGPPSGAGGPGGAGGEGPLLVLLARPAGHGRVAPTRGRDAGPRVGVGDPHRRPATRPPCGRPRAPRGRRSPAGARRSRPSWPPSGGCARCRRGRRGPPWRPVCPVLVSSGGPACAGGQGAEPGGRAHRDRPDPQGARGRAARTTPTATRSWPTSSRPSAATRACSG